MTYEQHQEQLAELHREMTAALLSRIKSGEATAGEMSVALKLLQHNGIQCNPEADPNLIDLAKVPFGKSDAL